MEKLEGLDIGGGEEDFASRFVGNSGRTKPESMQKNWPGAMEKERESHGRGEREREREADLGF